MIAASCNHPRRLAVAVCAFALVLASCTSSDTTATGSTNYAPLDDQNAATTTPVDPPPPAAASAGVVPDTAPVDQFREVTTVYDAFLDLRAKAITGKIAVGQLERVATPKAIDQVLAMRVQNEAKVTSESYAALDDLAEWSNVSQMHQVEDQLIFTDCTERQHVTPAGITVVTFVTNNVSVIEDAGQFKVDDVAVVQDGTVAIEPDTLGCVPPSFIERADLTARIAVDEAARLIADPSTAIINPLPTVFADRARVNLQAALDALAVQGYSRQADETVEFEVIGMDVNQPAFTAVVSVCRTFPNGRPYLDRTGHEVLTDIPAGSSTEEWVYVNLEAVASGTQTADVVVDVQARGPNCQKG